MANIGAGETRKAWLVKKADVTTIDSMLKDTSIEEIIKTSYAKYFKYRTLNSNEMTYQPISNWLKGKYDKVIFTSENTITPVERDKILFPDGRFLNVTRKLPQEQIGFYMFSGKYPVILELE